ncbi:MAG: hypothetical protein H6678_11725 [Candidatus Delongbacteria bacterium]|nr:hypothetical protein [Candidatus Delongbacteria bacterium]
MAEGFPWFSPDGYRRILERALELGYRIQCFRDFLPGRDAPRLLLRHDLDHSIRAALVSADTETRLGVCSTYFVQVECSFYNLLSAESRELVAELVSGGHEIGLHFSAGRYRGEQGARRWRLDLALLEDLAGHPIHTASQHLPSSTERFDPGDLIRREAYREPFMGKEMGYISDSLMAWRQATPLEWIEERRSFQFLTHPLTWSHQVNDLDQALDLAVAEEVQQLRAELARTRTLYHDLLAARERLDAEFRRSRG